MERFEGLAVLTTNLRSNVDEAFTRRLAAVVDFPLPDEDDRRRLWVLHLGEACRAATTSTSPSSRAFKLPGGNIRNIALTAAYLAAAAGGVVGMPELIAGTEREYRKLGRL
jgi:SpoVK/Ycf46/Vps4 family AAA+-type ATPase